MGGQKNRNIPGIFDQYDIYENCSVGNVFWLPIRQNEFFGTIEFFSLDLR